MKHARIFLAAMALLAAACTAVAADGGQQSRDEAGGKTLVVYFSATNTTKGRAETLCARLNADIFQIVPAIPYTAADLDWHDRSSRTTIECNDPAARPAISGKVENIAQYDVIYIGYPIWWGRAPNIICTFLEDYDFSGKTLIPFCTSGSSGMGRSGTNLHSLAPRATWKNGCRVGTDRDIETLVRMK